MTHTTDTAKVPPATPRLAPPSGAGVRGLVVIIRLVLTSRTG